MARTTVVTIACVAALVGVLGFPGIAQQPARLTVQAAVPEALRTWDAYVTARERRGDLRIRRALADPSVPGRTIERLQQYHGGVPVWGAEVVRDAAGGLPLAYFGELAPDLSLDTTPTLTEADAGGRALAAVGAGAVLVVPPRLVIRTGDGAPALAYTAVVGGAADVLRIFLDAHTGAELARESEIVNQAVVGTGRGVLGDEKKLSVVAQGGAFFADDQHRPPLLRTFDMRGDMVRALAVALSGAPLFPADRASDSDNLWTDPAAVDAHAHIGWTYDYYFTRHGRQGLDGSDRQLVTLINPATPQGALSLPASLFDYAINAFWCNVCGPGSTGVMFFGNGVPSTLSSSVTGQTIAPLAGSLDIAAHELSHGVISSSSRLMPVGESGALNEAFADIMGTSVEFFFQPPGASLGQADYAIGEDSFRAVRPGAVDGIRSLSTPWVLAQLLGRPDPDHYTNRYTGPQDAGGIHVNATIPGHAFYLAIEGGTNRTSGLAVQGVGAANREQIEKAFYRAFVFLLTPSSTFSSARATTIQAARDLYGVGSAAERAITQAWTAVGVN